MPITPRTILGLAILLVMLGFAVWLAWQALKRSYDPARLVGKWVLTLLLLGLMFKAALSGPLGMMLGILIGTVAGLLWVPAIGGMIGNLFGGLYTGGDVEVEPAPFYSIAEAQRKRGRYPEAVVEIRKQLDRFPQDFEGWMMLAEIQAVNLHDLPAAEESINQIVQSEHPKPNQISYALNRLADWHLRQAQDRVAAEAALQAIVELLPGTEYAQLAHQRIAHLASHEMLAELKEPRRLALGVAPVHAGLSTSHPTPVPLGSDPRARAAALVQHLEKHPADNEAREQLAVIYAENFDRLDLALAELEQLLATPGQPDREVVRWLNLMADLQLQYSNDAQAVRDFLHRIEERFPDSSAAENARKRLALLSLQLKAKSESRPIRLGVYEQNIGLKGVRPRRSSDFADDAEESGAGGAGVSG